MNKAHRIRLDPTPEQETLFRQHAGYHRLVYNWAVGEFLAALKGADVWLSGYDLNVHWTQVRKTLRTQNGPVWEWAEPLVQNVARHAALDAGTAVKNWGRYFQKRKKNASARKVGPPKRKKRGSRMSFRVDWPHRPPRSNGVKFDGKVIELPAALGGAVKMREEVRWPDACVISVRINRRGGHWYASVTVDDGPAAPAVVPNGKPKVGVDLGIKTMAVCSDDMETWRYYAPKPLKRMLARLRRLNKALARQGMRDAKGRLVARTANWSKTADAIAKLHARIADIRGNAIHQATTAIVRRAGSVKAEDLNIKGMMRNKKMSRAIADIGMGEFLRQLEYKCQWAGIPFERIDRWYPSSQRCNLCGWRNRTLKLSMRDWVCGGCGERLDRDANASANIRDYEGMAESSRPQPVEPQVRPARKRGRKAKSPSGERKQEMLHASEVPTRLGSQLPMVGL